MEAVSCGGGQIGSSTEAAQASGGVEVLLPGKTELEAAVPEEERRHFVDNVLQVELLVFIQIEHEADLGEAERFVAAGDPDTGAFAVYHFGGSRLLAVDTMNKPAEHMLARRFLAAGINPTKT